MSKSYKKNKIITGLEQFQMGRRSWGSLDPRTRVVKPKKGDGYKRNKQNWRQQED